ncbi:ABC transporter substrate-binding protein [Alkalihalobacillus sp. NPDC078783]
MDEKYLLLRAFLYEKEVTLSVQFTHEMLEELWFCTKRNVKRILKQLESEGYILYLPGKGRGHYSAVTFHKPFRDEIRDYVNEYLQTNNLDQLAFILRLPIPKSWIIDVSAEFQKLLGFKRSEESKDILYTFKSREITSLDPARSAIALEVHLIRQLGDTLVQYDAQQNQIVPHLAHHFKVDASEHIYTFYLRKDIYFHNMEKLSSADIVYTIRRLRKSKRYSWLVDSIKEVKAESPYRVSFYLRKKNAFFLQMLSTPTLVILPEANSFNEYEWLGSGPFMLKERTKTKLVLQAFEHYFKERALIDEVHFHTISKEAENVMYLQHLPEQTMQPEEYLVHDMCVVSVLFNQRTNSVLQDTLLRQAIYQLLDVSKLAADLSFDVKEASTFSGNRSNQVIKQKQSIPNLLIRSTYRGEVLKVGYLTNELTQREALWLIEEAREYGINLILNPIAHDQFYEPTIMNEVDLLFMKVVFSADWHLSFLSMFKNEQLYFLPYLQEAEKDKLQKLIQTFEETTSYQEREQIIIDVELLLKEGFHLIFLYHPVIKRKLDPIIQNATHHSYGHLDFSKLWLS